MSDSQLELQEIAKRSKLILLSAGASQRMGSPKALLRWQAHSFIEHLLLLYQQLGIGAIYIVLAEPHESIIRDHLESSSALRALFGRQTASAPKAAIPKINFVHNPSPSLGPIESIRQALKHAQQDSHSNQNETSFYWIHPVDIPAVSLNDLKKILEISTQCDSHPDQPIACIPSVNMRRAHPICINPELANRSHQLQSNEHLRTLLGQPDVQITYAELKNPWLLYDVDNIAAYQHLLKHLPQPLENYDLPLQDK